MAVCITLAALFAVVAKLAVAGGQPLPGAFGTPFISSNGPQRIVSASHESASTGLPQAFCQTPPAQKKGEPPTGFYRVRPHGCRFHRLGLEENFLSDLVFRIDWRHWTGASASGIGRVPVYGLNFKTGKHFKSSSPEVVRLSQPREICGHRIFTKLVVRDYINGEVANNFESELDEVGEAEEGCPRTR